MGCISDSDLALLNGYDRLEVKYFDYCAKVNDRNNERIVGAQIEFHDRIDRKRIADGMTTAGTIARLRSEGRSEDYIAGYMKGRR